MVPRGQLACPGLRCAGRDIWMEEAVRCQGPALMDTRPQGIGMLANVKYCIAQGAGSARGHSPHPMCHFHEAGAVMGRPRRGGRAAKGQGHMGCWKVAVLKVNRSGLLGAWPWEACVNRQPRDSSDFLLQPVWGHLLHLSRRAVSGRAEGTCTGEWRMQDAGTFYFQCTATGSVTCFQGHEQSQRPP